MIVGSPMAATADPPTITPVIVFNSQYQLPFDKYLNRGLSSEVDNQRDLALWCPRVALLFRRTFGNVEK